MRPLALIANDDGYASEGIILLAQAIATWAEVVVVAPESEQSASSHSLTLHRALRLRRVIGDAHAREHLATFALDGTPADCVYVALHSGTRILPRRPDLAISGINRGMNLGQDAFYSGTVAAAREAALRAIPAIAMSAHVAADLPAVAALASRLGQAVLADPPRTSMLLNVNVPRHWTGEVRPTRMGTRYYDESVEYRIDPRGREYLWVGGAGVRHENDPGSDTQAYDQGAAAITPLALDLSAAAAHPYALSLATLAMKS
jgi:5'-nucleotidase